MNRAGLTPRQELIVRHVIREYTAHGTPARDVLERLAVAPEDAAAAAEALSEGAGRDYLR